jgi:hypothetical protein
MPVEAFSAGMSDCTGTVFIPTHNNRDNIVKDIERVRAGVAEESQLKLLACLSTYVQTFEPQQIPGSITDAFFTHMVKEGIQPAHLTKLARSATAALREPLSNLAKQTHPMGIRLLTQMRSDSLREILSIVTKSTKNRALRSHLGELSSALKEFAKLFTIEGFKNESFEEVYALAQAKGCELARSDYYAQVLRDLYDYPETPDQVEEKGLQFLRNELGEFSRVVSELSTKFGSDPRAESLTERIRERKSLGARKVIAFLSNVRKVTVKLVNKKVVSVNSKYRTRVVETPRYLSAVVPSGAAFFLDYLSSRPNQLFLATTDPRRSPHTVPSELLNLLIHEEYGHCVHASNSAYAFAAKPSFTEMLSTHLGSAVSEGLSFQRELEFLACLNELQVEGQSGREEKNFVSFWKRFGGFDALKEEYEFYTGMWRILRFLRVIGDARINSGKQDLTAFIDWANKETGLSKSLVYHQVFPAHQGIGPGYASTYAMIGESIREIQKPLRVGSQRFVDFNTYATSMGFPPRTIFEKRLRATVS